MTVQHLSPEEFASEVLAASVPVLVDFYTDWCMPCRAMAPVLDSLARDLAERVKIVKVNVDDAPQLAARYRISSIPTLITFRDGQAVDTVVGMIAGPALRQRLESLLSPEPAEVR